MRKCQHHRRLRVARSHHHDHDEERPNHRHSHITTPPRRRAAFAKAAPPPTLGPTTQITSTTTPTATAATRASLPNLTNNKTLFHCLAAKTRVLLPGRAAQPRRRRCFTTKPLLSSPVDGLTMVLATTAPSLHGPPALPCESSRPSRREHRCWALTALPPWARPRRRRPPGDGDGPFPRW